MDQKVFENAYISIETSTYCGPGEGLIIRHKQKNMSPILISCRENNMNFTFDTNEIEFSQFDTAVAVIVRGKP